MWKMEEPKIIKTCRKISVLVNSPWLKEELAKHSIKSEFCHAGLDNWCDLNLRQRKTRIGFLYSTVSTKKWSHCEKLASQLGFKEYEYVAFGTGKCKKHWLTEYLRNPSFYELQQFYSQCHIWFAPTVLEGWHNPPAEASMCGALVVCHRGPRNGMHYADDRTAMLYETLPEAARSIQRPDYSKVLRMKNHLNRNVGTREKCMERLVKLIGGM